MSHGPSLPSKTTIALAAGAILLLLAAGWEFAFASHWTQRLPPGWTWSAHYIGVGTNPDPVTGEFPAEDTPSIYQRSMRILSRGGNSVQVADTYETRDIESGKTTFEYNVKWDIDSATGEHRAAEFQGQQLVFPRHVQKKTYALRANYVKGIQLAYEAEVEIEGLTTYRFVYRGRGEYTESYAGTAQYPGVAVAAGQEIRCADDRFVFSVWVEPLSGEILQLEESCLTGDYVYDIATGKKVAAVMRWSGATAGDDVLVRAGEIRDERARLLWHERYGPGLAALAGLALLAGAGTKNAVQRLRRPPARSAD